MHLSRSIPVTRWPTRTGLFHHLLRLARYRELFFTLLLRDIKARYRQSVLGLYWALLHPLAIALAFTLAFSFIVRVSVGGVPYFLFALSGILVWNFFAHGLADATESLVAHASLVTKVPFPRELLPLSAVAARCVDFFCSLGVVLALSLVFGLGVHLALVWMPLVFVLQLLFTAALGLVLSMANLYYRDIRQMVSVVLPLWMYMTPVIYPAELVPQALRFLLWLNPMAGLVAASRNIILYGTPPDWSPLLTTGVTTLVVLALAYVAFKHREPAFAEVV